MFSGGSSLVRSRVTDSGLGLPDTERQVFKAGRETPLRHGNELGLWLVNWIVTGVGGDVTATVDSGTTITLRLSLVDGTSAESGEHHRYGALSALAERHSPHARRQ